MEQRKKRILIVEDEKNIADILDYNVQKQGYDTDVAYDGEKGLALALSGGYDLILLDVMLPLSLIHIFRMTLYFWETKHSSSVKSEMLFHRCLLNVWQKV